MGKADAKVTVGADASAVERAAAAAKAAWRDTGSSIAGSMGGAARSIATSLSEVALAQGKVSFAGQHAQVREFEGSSARLAVSMGRDLESVRSDLERTGVALGKRPQEVAAWTTAVGRLTYNFEGAKESMRGMSALAAETGRSAEDYEGLAVELGTVGKVSGDTTHAIGVLQAQADKLATVGGISAFADQVEGLRDTVSRFAISSERDFLKITGLAAELGKGLSPAAAGRVQQSAFGAVAADPLRWERYLGHEITDEHGQVKDPAKVLQEITEKTKRRYGRDARRVLMLNFGAETGAAMYSANYAEAAGAAGFAPSDKSGAAQAAYLASDAGRRDVAEAQLAESSRALMGSATLLGRAADSLQRFSASNPIAGTFAAMAASNAIAGGMNAAAKMGQKGGAAGALGSLAGRAGGIVAALGVAAAGYEVGEWADEKFGLSDKISGTHTKPNWQAQDAGRDRAGIDAIKRANRALQLVGGGIGGMSDKEEAEGRAATMKVVQSNAALASGGADAAAAIAAELKKRGESEGDAARNAAAIAEALKNVKVEVVNMGDSPVTATVKNSSSAAAGSQAHG